jgi:hypothetical protein
MGFQELLDSRILGVTVRNIARAFVFGGIFVILLRKLLRKVRGQSEADRD